MPPLYAAEALEQRLLLAVLYVDLNAPGILHDGASWDSAYVDLQPALAHAQAGDQIRVAGGTYKPTADADRTKSFRLKSGVALYGGYGGHDAVNPDLRDIQLFPTILSGEIGDPATNSDNSYHVVYAKDVDATAILDGLTITAGKANGTTHDYGGGGMYSSSSSPTLTNCIFIGNSAEKGGGMFISSPTQILCFSPTLTNCAFSENTASAGGGIFNSCSTSVLVNCTFSENSASGGGGIYNSWSFFPPTLTNCTFNRNAADTGGGMYNIESSATLSNCIFSENVSRSGGGMCNSESSPTLTNCTFSKNSGSVFGGGGGMYNNKNSSPTLVSCTFIGNTACRSDGGGMLNFSSFPKLTNCTFKENLADNTGGGMHNGDKSAPSITNCNFDGNSATCGAGMCDSSSSPTLANCTFIANAATLYGGGMHNAYSSPMLTNSTFSGNSASKGGGGLYNTASSPTLRNCILWGNMGSQITNADSSTSNITYSLVQGGWEGAGNLDADPQFVRNLSPGPDRIWATADDDYGDLRLRSTSPAINAGNNAALPASLTTDLAGNPRLVRDIVDLGAYETSDLPAVSFAASSQRISEDIGTLTITISLPKPLAEPMTVPLQLSGTAAFDRDYRLLSPNPIVFELGSTSVSFGIEILNDDRYELSETLVLTLGEPTSNWYGATAPYTITILDDNDEPPVVYVDDTARGANNGLSWADAYTSLQAALQAVEVGATILVAAGTYNPGARRTDSFQLKNHVAIYGGFPDGGGTWQQRNWAANPTILSGEIGDPGTTKDNSHHVVYASGVDATAILDGLIITGGNANRSYVGNYGLNGCGGGMYNNAYACPTLVNCTFSGNSAPHGGGMCSCNSSSPTLSNCTFSGNSAIVCGGGIYSESSFPTLINCMFKGNSASSAGGGMSNYRSSLTLTNCTFIGNSATLYGGGVDNSYNSSSSLNNCNFSENSAGKAGSVVFNSSSSLSLGNCILWGNRGSQIGITNGGTINITHSLVQGGWEGIGNLDADPQFIRNPDPGPDGVWGTADDDYGDLRLQPTSPAINAGSNAALPIDLTTDLASNPRLANGIVDLGAYEYPGDELTLAGSATDTFHLRISGSTLEVFRNTQPDQAPPSQSIPLNSLTRLRLQGGQYTLASNLARLELYLENDSQVKLASSQRLAFLNLRPTATLDLADHDLIISATPETKAAALEAISNAIKSARSADGKWAGTGLNSSAAKANKQTGLAVMLNEKNGKPILTSFDGQSVGENDILVKYTWNGDVNLDGAVDAADYFLVDSGFITQQGGCRNGDLNFDGKVDAADYFLIDSAFIAQSGPLAAQVPAATEESIMLKAAIAPRPQSAPSVLAQLFSAEPVL